MNITVADVRDALRKDDLTQINTDITRLIASAKSSLLIGCGWKESGENLPKIKVGYTQEFESLSNQYIIEYCRSFIDQVDNDRTLTALAVQIEALIDEENGVVPQEEQLTSTVTEEENDENASINDSEES